MTRFCIVFGCSFLFFMVLAYAAANDPLLWLTPDHYSMGVVAR